MMRSGLSQFKAIALAVLTSMLSTAASLAQPFDPERAENSVVQIIAVGDNATATGSGFIVALRPHAYIVTNNHVVEGRNRFVILNRSIPTTRDSLIEAELVDRNPGMDLALLRVTADLPDTLEAVTLAPNVERAKGANVFAMGYPGAANVVMLEADLQPEASLTEGSLSREFRGGWDGETGVRVVQHDAAISGGNSGGPLFDACNRVVGVNTAGPRPQVTADRRGVRVDVATGVSFASAVEETEAFLERNDVVFATQSRVCAIGGPAGTLSPLHIAGGAIALLLAAGAGYILFKPGGFGTGASPSPASPAPSPDIAAGALPPVAAPGAAPGSNTRTNQGSMNLRITSPSGTVKRQVLSSALFDDPYGVTIGRSSEFCDIAVRDPKISKRHVRVFRVEGSIYLEDLNASNPVSVNGRKLKPFEVCPIDRDTHFTAGATRFSVQKSAS